MALRHPASVQAARERGAGIRRRLFFALDGRHPLAFELACPTLQDRGLQIGLQRARDGGLEPLRSVTQPRLDRSLPSPSAHPIAKIRPG